MAPLSPCAQHISGVWLPVNSVTASTTTYPIEKSSRTPVILVACIA